MEGKDFNALIDKVKEHVKEAVTTQLKDAADGLVTTEHLEQTLETAGLTEGAIKELTDAVASQGEEMKKLFAKQEPEAKTIGEQLKEKANEIKSMVESKNQTMKFNVGQKAQVTRGSVANNTLGMRVPGIGQLPYLGTVISNIFRHAPVGPNSNGVIRYFDQAAITRGADNVAEGGVKPESAITWEERTLTLEKIADSIPVTMESFADLDFIESEVRRLLDVNLALKEDQQLWAGTGTSPQLTGVFTKAPLFNAGAYAGPQAQDAQLYDLLAILKVEISNGKQSKYTPNGVVMNPADILRYKLAKATDGHYVLPPFISQDGTVIDAMQVIESSQVTPNTLVIGDWTYGTVYDLQNVTVSMGWINDQFVRNAMTILAEKRLGLLIKDVDADAFLKVDDIDAAITAVTQ